MSHSYPPSLAAPLIEFLTGVWPKERLNKTQSLARTSQGKWARFKDSQKNIPKFL